MRVVALFAAAVVATGALPLTDAGDVTRRALPVLAFLVAATVLAGLSDGAGVFEVAADGCARLAGCSVRRLWLLVATLATVTTVLLSLDTTAVLLTPVVLAVTARCGLRAAPFAFLVVWLANTASLLLPVSNLTTLLAVDRLGLGAGAYAARTVLPETAAVLTTVMFLTLWFRRDVRGTFTPGAAPPRGDRWLLGAASVACLALGPAVVLGAPPWVAAGVGALVVAGTAALRRPRLLRPGLLPWRLVVLTESLFLVVATLSRHGLDTLLRHLIGTGTPLGGLRTAAVATVVANAANNLPGYLALEAAVPAGGTGQLLAVLVGTNAGTLVLLTGSLASLLWRERCAAGGLRIGGWE